MPVCEQCGTDSHVRRGLCRRCRRILDEEATLGGERVALEDEHEPVEHDLEPPKPRPWVHRLGG